jgi:hypothetical protein
MATPLTRFEIQIPNFADGTTQSTAVNTFLDGLGVLTNFIANNEYVHTSSSDPGSYTKLVFGHITVAQQAAALALLATLNTALGTPVLCTIWTVTTEP